MTIDPANIGSSGLVERAKNILMKPQAEWERIAGEPADINKLYIGYALPLIVLAAVAGFIGTSLLGTSAFGVTVRVPLGTGLALAVYQIVAGLVGLFVMGVVTNALAPNFGSVQDQGKAHQLAVYGATAGLLGGLFAILPLLAILGLAAGIYSLVLLYIGLPRMMKTPEDKRVGYFATIIVVCIVIGIVFSIVSGSVLALSGGLNSMMPHIGATAPTQQQNASSSNETVTLPGGGQVSVSELEKMGQAYANGSAQPVDPTKLQGYLPQSLPGGFALVSSANASAMGTSQATGVYQSGDARMEIEIVSLGAMGALTAAASAANVQQNEQSAEGYSRTSTVDGRVYNEESSDNGRRAKFAVVGRGVAITAEGSNGVTVDQVRAAVEVIGIQRLETVVRN